MGEKKLIKHIVILESSGSEYGLEVLKAAISLDNIKVTFIVKNIHRYSKYKDFFPLLKKMDVICANTQEANEVIETIKIINKTDKEVDGIVSLTDKYVSVAASVAEYFNFPFINERAVEISRNKEKMRELCKKNSLETPEFGVAKSLEEALEIARQMNFPIVVKANNGTGSQNVTLVQNLTELQKKFNKLLDSIQKNKGLALLEEFISGPLVSVEAVTYKGETSFWGITDRSLGTPPYFVEKAYTFPVNVGKELENKLFEQTNQIIEMLNIKYGVTHTEFIIHEGEPYLVELNPRLGGSNLGRMLSESMEVNIFCEIINLHLGIKPKNMNRYKATSTYTIYPQKQGRVVSIEGLDRAEDSPGVIDIKKHLNIGDVLDNPFDFQGQVATVWTKGETSDLSKNYADYASNQIVVKIEKLNE